MSDVFDLDLLFGTTSTGRRPAASGSVLELLKTLIAQGQLRPGQRLPSEKELADRIGISRASLREGISALVAMNIVVVRQGDGTYVSSLDPELLAQPLQLILSVNPDAIFSLFEVRRITEPVAAALAAERASTAEVDALRDEMKNGIDSHQISSELVAHDSRLHRLIHQAAHNPVLTSVSASLAGLIHHARQRTVKLPRNATLTISEHEEIVDAITARDAERSRRAMTIHLVRVENDLRDQLQHDTPRLLGVPDSWSAPGKYEGGDEEGQSVLRTTWSADSEEGNH